MTAYASAAHSFNEPGVTTQATSPRRAIAEARPQVSSLSSTSPIMSVTSSSPSSCSSAIEHFQVRADDSFEPAFAAISQSGCNALLTFPDALTFFHRRAIADFAVRRRLPSIFGWKPYVEAGGMMSYGPILRDNFARLAVFVDKIFKGATPAYLPVEQPTKFELVINLKTAKALGL